MNKTKKFLGTLCIIALISILTMSCAFNPGDESTIKQGIVTEDYSYDYYQSQIKKANFIELSQEIGRLMSSRSTISNALDEELQVSMTHLINNPEKAYEEISESKKGTEVIDLINAIYLNKPAHEILTKAEPLLSTEELQKAKSKIAVLKQEVSASRKLTANDLHVMAGYASGILASSIIVATVWLPVTRAVLIGVISWRVAKLFGIWKEKLDSEVFKGKYDQNDIDLTKNGGHLSHILSNVVAAAVIDPFAGAAILGTAGSVLGVIVTVKLLEQVRDKLKRM